MQPRPKASAVVRTPPGGAVTWTIFCPGPQSCRAVTTPLCLLRGVSDFIAALRKREATAALALELCILTAARSGEILGMHWSEVDLKQKIWTVPASRMKAGREH